MQKNSLNLRGNGVSKMKKFQVTKMFRLASYLMTKRHRSLTGMGRMLMARTIARSDHGAPAFKTSLRLAAHNPKIRRQMAQLLAGAVLKGKLMYAEQRPGVKSKALFHLVAAERCLTDQNKIAAALVHASNTEAGRKNSKLLGLADQTLVGEARTKKLNRITRSWRALINPPQF